MKIALLISTLALVLTTGCKKQAVAAAEPVRAEQEGRGDQFSGNPYYIDPHTIDGFHIEPFISCEKKPGC